MLSKPERLGRKEAPRTFGSKFGLRSESRNGEKRAWWLRLVCILIALVCNITFGITDRTEAFEVVHFETKEGRSSGSQFVLVDDVSVQVQNLLRLVGACAVQPTQFVRSNFVSIRGSDEEAARENRAVPWQRREIRAFVGISVFENDGAAGNSRSRGSGVGDLGNGRGWRNPGPESTSTAVV
jgi:hypothetical protein